MAAARQLTREIRGLKAGLTLHPFRMSKDLISLPFGAETNYLSPDGSNEEHPRSGIFRPGENW